MASEWLKIRNWDRWQSYRKDRGQPPWIKLHRQLMRDHDWILLTDAQRGQLIAMWLLAADQDGKIPSSPALIKKLCFLENEPDLQVFTERGFIESWRQRDANVTPTWRQDDANMTHQNREEENRSRREAEAEEKQKREGICVCEAIIKSGSRKGERCGNPAKGEVAGEWRCGTHGAVEDYSPEFEEFWNVCLNQVGKGDAWNAWPKALSRAAKSSKREKNEPAAEFLVRRMRDFSEASAHKELKYVRHPSTWLNGANWDDEAHDPFR